METNNGGEEISVLKAIYLYVKLELDWTMLVLYKSCVPSQEFIFLVGKHGAFVFLL